MSELADQYDVVVKTERLASGEAVEPIAGRAAG